MNQDVRETRPNIDFAPTAGLWFIPEHKQGMVWKFSWGNSSKNTC